MKKNAALLLTLSVLLVMGACVSSKNAEQKALEKAQKTRERIEANHFTIDVTGILQARNADLNRLGVDYTVTIRNDSVFSHLPYFGAVHTAPFGGQDAGIQLKAPVKDYRVDWKKGGWIVNFKTDYMQYRYSFTISIAENANSIVQVNSLDREPISFSGIMNLDDPQK